MASGSNLLQDFQNVLIEQDIKLIVKYWIYYNESTN